MIPEIHNTNTKVWTDCKMCIYRCILWIKIYSKNSFISDLIIIYSVRRINLSKITKEIDFFVEIVCQVAFSSVTGKNIFDLIVKNDVFIFYLQQLHILGYPQRMRLQIRPDVIYQSFLLFFFLQFVKKMILNLQANSDGK